MRLNAMNVLAAVGAVVGIVVAAVVVEVEVVVVIGGGEIELEMALDCAEAPLESSTKRAPLLGR